MKTTGHLEFGNILSAEAAKEQLEETIISVMIRMTGLSRQECKVRREKYLSEATESLIAKSAAENCP